ncbi:MAG: 3-keto-disaccharide hydrolase, partial [Pyrinomonadaceae bacterium]
RTALCVIALGLISISTLAVKREKNSSQDAKASINKLTPEEKATGWELLFDGKRTNKWRGAYMKTFPASGWIIEDGSLKHLKGTTGSTEAQHGGDIVTINEYSSFELQLEWRISPGGNSGIKYFVTEALPKPEGATIGLEYQILDDDRHPDARMGREGNRTAASLYDLIPAKDKELKAVGEFNLTRLVVNGNHVEHWLNGKKVLEYELRSPELKQLIAESKYKSIPGFGEWTKGHILLQDHGDEVAFRNIKIRALSGK